MNYSPKGKNIKFQKGSQTIEDQGIRTKRGSFVLSKDSMEKLKKEGYGYYFEENDYVILANGTQAVAVKRQVYELSCQ